MKNGCERLCLKSGSVCKFNDNPSYFQIGFFLTDYLNLLAGNFYIQIFYAIFAHLLQSKNEQTLLYIGVKPCAKGSIYVALEWGYLYLTFFNISNNLFDFLTSNNLGVESEAGFGM